MADLRIDYMPLDELLSAERNPKDHAPAVIAASVDRFGYIEAIVLDERTGRIVAGHGRRDDVARRRADGLDAPKHIRVEDGVWLVPVSRGWESKDDDEASAAGIALNQGTIAGGWIRDALFSDLDALSRSTAGLDGTGFSLADLADLAVLAGPPPDLDQLAAKHGEPSERDFWPTVTLTIAPTTKQAWDDLMVDLGHDDENDAALALIQFARSGWSESEGP